MHCFMQPLMDIPRLHLVAMTLHHVLSVICFGAGALADSISDCMRCTSSELILEKGMRTATFQFSESGGSVNGPNLFTELPFL